MSVVSDVYDSLCVRVNFLNKELDNARAANRPLGEQCVRFLGVIRSLLSEIDKPGTLTPDEIKAIRKLAE